MADQSWPSSLPQKQFTNIVHQPSADVLETDMDEGPNKKRPLTTAITEDVSIPMIFTGDQYETFLDWWKNTLGQGSLRFDWESPIDDTTVEFRFRGTDAPQFDMVKGESASGNRKWVGTLELEIMP